MEKLLAVLPPTEDPERALSQLLPKLAKTIASEIRRAETPSTETFLLLLMSQEPSNEPPKAETPDPSVYLG
ncbi:hypothetical protein Mterra_02126 [Calidithermus terrae]|uniref:Uncharacterized protein n=1 Tax=Calidithermus terrae TaxID=1408545 RepID=A0A399EKB2_9DEIN|nr:hypothetical protein [Calidithermus terrae]RIH83913.1 hypothetical protein Mterra_02126 [Calidithermus terrae]